MCVILPNVIKIGQALAVIWPFNGFSKIAAVRHLGLVGARMPTMNTWWSLS